MFDYPLNKGVYVVSSFGIRFQQHIVVIRYLKNVMETALQSFPLGLEPIGRPYTGFCLAAKEYPVRTVVDDLPVRERHGGRVD